ncbi:uncharacterized protein LY89DRAFT_3279 [Mollisia scopiformis]|uniref:Xylanolytic transcriptional activator regulatory domain-containing protein n=1 Tax=Mollisia scopiformis TaxID=149040 RepID=A0A194XUB2_MOLSC|nr:uncharacterized protein LY89DRAFT_3279 [Mollisia scopiformis]KUJ23798.1 hypothetical protein LY89DRAFT_3279 [Mollisia scopiformis]
MEDRIKRMESALITSRLHATTEPVEWKEEEKEEEKSSSERIESQAELSNHLSNLVIDARGSPNFIGLASGFSIFAPRGLRWISEKVGDKNELAQLFDKLSNSDYRDWGRGDADLWYPTPRSQHSPLPSKDVALQYVNCFFITFNNFFPILNRTVFNSYFQQQYSANPPTSSAWYALFNGVLCLGSSRTKLQQEAHIRRSCLVDYTSVAQETGVEYFRNASSCFHDLFFKEANLMAMQALTIMLFIATSSPNPQPAYAMTSAVGCLVNTLGLHRNSSGTGLAPEEIEQRRNVFWVFYLLEKACSHNLGRPSVINDDDIAVDLPPKKPGLIQSPTGAKVYDIFQDQVRLAIIGSRIYTELYSASGQTKSEVDRMKILGKLDNHLQRWRDSIPIDIRPEHPIECSDEQYVSVVMIHFTYLDAVILLHRCPGLPDSSRDGKPAGIADHDPRSVLNPRIYASQLLCLAAARRTIRLLDTFSSNTMHNQHLMWLALYYPLSASLVLFANILSNPHDQHATSDIGLMNLIISFIDHSVQPGTSFAATPTISMCKELYSIATRVVARVPPQSSRRMKRIPESDDLVQPDFISPSQGSDRSLFSNFNTQTTTPITHPETDIPSTISSGQQILQEDQESTTSGKHSQASTGDSPLDFAPFIQAPPSQFDYDPTIYDPLLSQTSFNWDMDDMWSFAPDPWASEDLMGLPTDVSMNYPS